MNPKVVENKGMGFSCDVVDVFVLRKGKVVFYPFDGLERLPTR